MDYEVEIIQEHRRLNGYRKPDKGGVGVYLTSIGHYNRCERLPWPLTVCPVCGEGIRPARSYRWIDPRMLFNPALEPKCDPYRHGHDHWFCPVCKPDLTPKAMLMWVGEKFYRTPDNFMEEARKWGISKKVPHIPRGLEIGVSGVFLAHKRAILVADRDPKPGIFTYFVPQQVDLVVESKPLCMIKEGTNMVIDGCCYHTADLDRAKKLKDQLGDKARIVVIERLEGR